VQNSSCISDCFSAMLCSDERETYFSRPCLFICEEMVPVFEKLCQLLVEISSIPTFSERKKFNDHQHNVDSKLRYSGCVSLPVWFQQLLVLSLYTRSSVQVCYASIGTVL